MRARPTRTDRGRRRRSSLGATVALVLTLAGGGHAHADRLHTVRSGQSLARIANRYGVSIADLAAANGMSPHDALRPGQVLRVPDSGVVYVRAGQTLAQLARRHGVDPDELARENGLRPGATLRVGQRLVLPGSPASEAAIAAAHRWGRPRAAGVIDVLRVSDRQRARVRAVDRRGRVPTRALDVLARLMREPGRRGRAPRPDPRLVEMLARVSDHFGGRTILLVSGFRSPGGFTRESSRHVTGRAIDFRVRGVPNEAVRDFCRTLPDVGVGYYPRSTFVHLDVRERSAYWVDWSRPGEPPQYRDPSEGPPPEEEGDVGAARDADTETPDPAATGLDDGHDPERTRIRPETSAFGGGAHRASRTTSTPRSTRP
ncbi:MAG: LysM peptidoglycan-binding domain-containing protein [Myxococcota bacterium]|nr:LysM peptidoglycan-binding domain-containing protein [Myxococcota bacterium]MDW8362911.1 LysM peptidoglycan-binding domain-containing protein [Myxococcales bacterium]